MGEKNEKIDFRSPTKLAQEKRREEIISTFLGYKEQATEGSSVSRIMEAVAQKVGCTTQNVRNCLIKHGVYKPKHHGRRVRA